MFCFKEIAFELSQEIPQKIMTFGTVACLLVTS